MSRKSIEAIEGSEGSSAIEEKRRIARSQGYYSPEMQKLSAEHTTTGSFGFLKDPIAAAKSLFTRSKITIEQMIKTENSQNFNIASSPAATGPALPDLPTQDSQNLDTLAVATKDTALNIEAEKALKATNVQAEADKIVDNATGNIGASQLLNEIDAKKAADDKTNTALGVKIAKAIQRNELIFQDICSVLLRNVDTQNENMVKLSKEDSEHLRQLIEELSKKEDTETVKNLLMIASASSAIVIGALLLAPETLAIAGVGAATSSLCGGLFITSGIADIVLKGILPKIGGYEKLASLFTNDPTKKQNLADNFYLAGSIGNTIVKVATSIAAGPVLGKVLSWAQGLNIFTTGVDFANAGINAKSNYHEYNYKNVEAEKIKIDGNIKDSQFNIEKAFESLKSANEMEEATGKISFHIFQILQEIQQSILNKGR
ncbi:MAG: hypothetical protein KR126chlam6_00171 [Candidatus Anoxychlamydiales bacterium]|nr:hypothetical protein [Candidatus Anoxychlamydiales bacterium]